MPISTPLDKSRAQVADPLSGGELRKLAKDTNIRVVQASEPLSEKSWRRIDETVLSERSDIQLRVFGFYSGGCDLAFVSKLENVQHFAADCLQSAQNVQAIGQLGRLRSLSLGVFDLQSFGFLESLPDDLERLSIGATRSKKPDLAVIGRFRELRELYIEGQHKNIEVISNLVILEDLTLRSITTADLSYVTPLSSLWSFDLKLGGITDLSALSHLKSLKYLEAWQVRGLSNLDVLASLASLQNLFLQSLPQVEHLPPLHGCVSLRRVVLQNMKGLRDFSALEDAPALEEFLLVQGEPCQPSHLQPVLRNRSLRRAAARFGSQKRNDEFADLVAASGKAAFEWTEFEYR